MGVPDAHFVRLRRIPLRGTSLRLSCGLRPGVRFPPRGRVSPLGLPGGTDMWYFTWILGLGLALAFGIINVMWLEASYFSGELDEERVRKRFQRGGRPID